MRPYGQKRLQNVNFDSLFCMPEKHRGAGRKYGMKRERLDQKEFYIRLSEALGESSGDIWAETVLSGSHAGEKYLVRNGAGEDGEFRAGGESVRRLLKIPSERL